jgi:hypothetical protein
MGHKRLHNNLSHSLDHIHHHIPEDQVVVVDELLDLPFLVIC